MAKRGRKSNKEKKRENHTQLNGFLLMMIAIIGLGNYIGDFGPVGSWIASLSVFLVGDGHVFLLVVIFVVGLYMMFQRKWPKFFSVKFLGFYFICFSALALLHTDYVLQNLNFVSIIKETLNDIMPAFDNFSDFLDGNGAGGGIIGALLSFVLFKLFSEEGAKIVIISLISIGVIFITGINFVDLIKNIFKNLNSGVKKLAEKEKVAIAEAEKEFEEEKDEKIVISSLDELTHPVEEKPIKEEVKPSIEENFDGYKLPSIDLLVKGKKSNQNRNAELIDANAKSIVRVLNDFDIVGKVTMVHPGPTVTQYEVELKSGTKVNKVLGINREIALALAAKQIRIQAPIPGKSTIGIELPNEEPEVVSMRDVLAAAPNSKKDSKLLVSLGKNIMGEPQFLEINKAPHLLVAGATGSGKSVCINSIIISILMRTKPDEVKLLLIDPKQVELNVYNGIPHLLREVVTNPRDASLALKRVVTEMEERYRLFKSTGTKNIAGYNAYVETHNKNTEDKLPKLPFLVVIVDELADLMIVAAKEVEESIIRITQLARAAGIHLIIATQRPSTDVVTGLIKANLPSRISFAVASSIDSRTILDMMGAEKLLGKGDMLFLPQDENAPIRIQGSWISDKEIKKVIDFVCKQQKAKYDDLYTDLVDKEKTHNTQEEQYEDPLYEDVVEFIVTNKKASASLIQRRFKVGYNRAARIVDLLEERGIIGPQNGSKPREVLVELDEDK